jgi:small subunit ribosomal protein S1
VSELSWKHVDHPSEVVSVGEEVEVEVLDVDLERERVSLSLKATQEDPWKEFERKYQAGEIVEGQVTKLVPFGAFVRVAQGIEGLVHISELSDQHVESPEAVLSVGDEVRVKVIDVDVTRRRISLSMRQVGGQPLQPKGTEIEAEADPEPGAASDAAADVPAVPLEPAPDFADMEEAVEAVGEPEAAAGPGTSAATDTAAGPEAPDPLPAPEPMPTEPTPTEPTPGEPEPAAEADVSLESILADLKRREGRD